jgi:hypothetical protein
MGNNGFVWICPTLLDDGAGGFVQNLEVRTKKLMCVHYNVEANSVETYRQSRMPTDKL